MVEGTKLETHHDPQNAVFGIIRKWVNAPGDASIIMGNTLKSCENVYDAEGITVFIKSVDFKLISQSLLDLFKFRYNMTVLMTSIDT
jgi:hypothetical protein